MKHSQSHHKAFLKKGFASILTVVSIGVGLLIILVSMYENTVEAQAVQSNNTLKSDYQQREDAFLRALVSITPNKAMLCMQDDSANFSVNQDLRWTSIIQEAMELSNAEIAVDPSVAAALGIDSMRNGNVTNTAYNAQTIVKPVSRESSFYVPVTSGTNMQASTSFPPPLECTDFNRVLDGTYPTVGYHKKYGSSSIGWVQDSVTTYPHYNRVHAPKLNFKYQNSDYLIAKHNWWAFKLSFATQNKEITKLESREKYYLLSLYEIPSQLPINASTFASFGAHVDGTEWSNIDLRGGVFAEKVTTEGAFSTEAISSRKGVSLSNQTTVNGNVTANDVGSNPFSSEAREKFQSKGDTFPISSSSDGGRVSFVPINRGLEFYDHFAGTNDTANSSNAISPTSWDYYSIGAKQCRMRLTVTDVVSSADQTPTQIEFSYYASDPANPSAGGMVTETFTKGDNWPEETEAEGETFPFHVENSASGRPSIAIHAERLADYLEANNAGYFNINKSISVNVDYVNNLSIEKPPFPSAGGDIAVLLQDGKDLTKYTHGFSMVCNMRLIIADDLNIVPTTAPAGVSVPAGEEYYPPLSLFAPEKRYGDSGIALKINIDGQLGSLARGNSTPVRIADLKSGVADEVIPSNISATLKSITHPAALPPITLMNWMVVVREIHPDFTPAYAGNN